MVIRFLEGTTLEERQMLYYNGSHCVYCGEPTEWIDSGKVYQESYGMIYYCEKDHAWVNCHGQSQDQAFGFVAKKELRMLRHNTHLVFDPLWQSKVWKGLMKKHAAQVAARKWMADYLEIDISEAHIGMMQNSQCEKLIAKCKEFYLTPEQVEQHKIALQERINTVKGICDFWEIELKEFYLNGQNRMEMRHGNSKKTLLYDPKKNIGGWVSKKLDLKPVEQLFHFIDNAFKLNEDAT